jgi:hypothetical protein
MPRVRLQAPLARLVIIGSDPTARVLALDRAGATIVANVGDAELREWYAMARVAVVPLRYGAGVKRKVVEALREALPLVTTPVGAQGLPGLSAVAAVCGTAETIAAAIVALLGDDGLWSDRSDAGIAYARAHFSQAMLRTSLCRAMGVRDVMSRTRLPRAAEVVVGAPRPYRRRAGEVDATHDDAAYAEPALAPEGTQHGKPLLQVGEQVGDVLQADMQPYQRAGEPGTTGGAGDETAGR